MSDDGSTAGEGEQTGPRITLIGTWSTLPPDDSGANPAFFDKVLHHLQVII
jgi:hypothetical protein